MGLISSVLLSFQCMQQMRLCAYFCALNFLYELTRQSFAIMNPLISPQGSRFLNKGGAGGRVLNEGPLKGDGTLLEIPLSIDELNEF